MAMVTPTPKSTPPTTVANQTISRNSSCSEFHIGVLHADGLLFNDEPIASFPLQPAVLWTALLDRHPVAHLDESPKKILKIIQNTPRASREYSSDDVGGGFNLLIKFQNYPAWDIRAQENERYRCSQVKRALEPPDHV
jgi:hypothetical protein